MWMPKICRGNFAVLFVLLSMATPVAAQALQVESTPADETARGAARRARARSRQRAKTDAQKPAAQPAAKPAEKPAEKKDAKSSESAPTVKSRKARRPGTDDQSEDLKIALGEDGKVAFQIKEQPWEEVLEWLAGLASLNLSLDEVPEDPCNLVTHSRYTVAEAQDVLNGLLLSKGFTLLQDHEVLYLVKVDQLDPSRVPRVVPEELDSRGRNEMLKVIFPLDSLIAGEVENEVKSLLGTHGKVTALKATNRLEVLGTGGSLRDVRDFLASEQSSQRKLVRQFRLEHTRAVDVAAMLRTLLGLKEKSSAPLTPQQQQQQMQMAQMRAQQQAKGGAAPEQKEPEVHLAVNDRNNSLLVTGPPDKIAIVQQAIEVIDRPENASEGDEGGIAAALRRPQVVTYYLSGVAPSLVVKILEGTGELDPRTRLEADAGTKSIIAYAIPKDHGTISAFVKEIDGTGRHLEVIQLYVLPADMAAGSIEALMKGKPKEEDNSRNRYFGYYSSRRSSGSEKDPSEEFQIEADVENNRLLLRATEFELAEVKHLLAKLGEDPDRSRNTSTLRTLQMAPTDQQSLLRAIEQLWPKMAPGSRLNITRPETGAPLKESGDSAPEAGDEKSKDGKAKNVAYEPSSAEPAGTVLTSYEEVQADSQGATDDEASQAEQAQISQAEEAYEPPLPGHPGAGGGGDAPPLTIVPGPNGLMISSPDPEVLDRLEQLVNELTPKQSEFQVFYLTKAYADDVADILEDVFKEDDDKDDGNSGYMRWWYGFDPSSGSKDVSLSLSRRKPLKIIPDLLTNSLLVRASPDQLAEIRELLKVLDNAPPSNPETARLLKLLPVYNTTAKEVAAIIEDVFREFLSDGDPARGGAGGNNKPNVSARYVTNYNFSGGGSSGGGKMDGVLSVGVDERNNTLILSAPRELLAEIESMVEQIDAQAKRPKQVIRVLNVQGSGSLESVQDALNVVVGGKKPGRPQDAEANQKPQDANRQPQVEAQVD